ncbi:MULTISPECIES: hypothetical protein [Actinosynnema]|uniref:Uncharacterized protein n=1 Tax=Actinosynnema pretiosum TaxID=42197 RepID=A0A290ZAT2_9PSEU|nr:hypothetical protein [Actinosynnema pretiosum]ATE56131.1 hypothetical protein CNX65_25005 [Actinosynnema pretiosum]
MTATRTTVAVADRARPQVYHSSDQGQHLWNRDAHHHIVTEDGRWAVALATALGQDPAARKTAEAAARLAAGVALEQGARAGLITAASRLRLESNWQNGWDGPDCWLSVASWGGGRNVDAAWTGPAEQVRVVVSDKWLRPLGVGDGGTLMTAPDSGRVQSIAAGAVDAVLLLSAGLLRGRAHEGWAPLAVQHVREGRAHRVPHEVIAAARREQYAPDRTVWLPNPPAISATALLLEWGRR